MYIPVASKRLIKSNALILIEVRANKTGSVGITNNEAPSCNHCCSGKAIRITYSVCLFVALFVQHATRMRHCHLWLVRLTKVLHIIS